MLSCLSKTDRTTDRNTSLDHPELQTARPEGPRAPGLAFLGKDLLRAVERGVVVFRARLLEADATGRTRGSQLRSKTYSYRML